MAKLFKQKSVSLVDGVIFRCRVSARPGVCWGDALLVWSG